MKKLLSLILVIALAVGANAQQTLTQTDPAGAAATVNTNADTSYHTVDLAGQSRNFEWLNFVVKGTKTSGTVGGAVTLWGSMDNSRWYAVYGYTNADADSLITSQSLTDASVDLIFHVPQTKFRYYRVRVITTGTQVSAYDCYHLGRKVAN